ncbi:MAG: hypothetical protein V9G12_22625 [Microthrixaceae bacterium]
MKVAYLTGEYPRATDTFIQREILAVERCGVDVERFAVRRPGDEHMVGERQRSERDLTTYLLEQPSSSYAGVLARALRRSPRRFLAALRLAVRTASARPTWRRQAGGVLRRGCSPRRADGRT